MQIEVELKQAVHWHRQNQLEKAGNAYRRILDVYPNHAATLNLMGLIEYQKNNHDAAYRLLAKAIQNDRKVSEYHNNLGTVLKVMGRVEEARNAYLTALALEPDCADTAYNLAGLYLIENDLDNAIIYYQRVIFKRKEYFQAYTNLSAIYNQRKSYQNALDCAQEGLRYAADDIALLANMGKALNGLGKWQQGIEVLKRIIKLTPESEEGYLNLGNALQDMGNLQDALVYYQKASEQNPDNPKIYNDMGTVLNLLGKPREALHCCQRAIRLNPEEAFVYHNMGSIFLGTGEYQRAIQCFKKAVALSPSLAEAHIMLGTVLQEVGKDSEAAACYHRAIELDPDYGKPYCQLVRMFQNECCWDELLHYGAIMDRHTQAALEKGVKPDEVPFLNLSRHCDPLLNYRVARAWGNDRRQWAEMQYGNLEDRHIQRHRTLKVTIGYLSNNFKNHPTAHLIMGLFQYHNRDRFNIYCYSYGENDNSIYRRKIETDCDRFIDLSRIGHLEAALQIRKDEVDILVDLVGQMKSNRMEICALRPAPVQVRWLGMAGTSGADFYDYIITDRIVTPEDQAEFYSETFAYMPFTYQINNDTQQVDGKRIQRKEVGLPEEGIVYACFCSTYKIDPVMFGTWMNILQRVPGSVLWLLEPSPEARKNFRSEVEKCGIDPTRIVFAQRWDRPRHIARIALADLCLDTRIVNGAATTSEALWAGTPVLTLKGRHFASRMAASILSAMELPELIAHSLDDYEHAAVKFAEDHAWHHALKRKVFIKKSSTSLFDTQRFVKNLENLLIQMQAWYESGGKKRILNVLKQAE